MNEKEKVVTVILKNPDDETEKTPAEVIIKEETEKTGRIFMITQCLQNPKTGETLITPEQVEKALKHKTIKRWAWVLHDRDIGKDNKLTEPHLHSVIECPNKYTVRGVAKWFGVPEKHVKILNGKGAFLDGIEYLTHERDSQQEQGKQFYSDSEIHANFDFRAELNRREEEERQREENIDKYNTDKLKYVLRQKVRDEGLTIEEIRSTKKGRDAYVKDYKALQDMRAEYLLEHAQMPPLRITIYVWGDGSAGKTEFCKAFARALFPGEPDDEIFFTVGKDKVSFDVYRGQPIIIFDDTRPDVLIKAFGGQGGLYEYLNLQPSKSRQNVKYSSVVLTNSIVIINSPLAPQWFMSTIRGGEQEDIKQILRRFQIIVQTQEKNYLINVNKDVWNGIAGKNAFENYTSICVPGSMQQITAGYRQDKNLANAKEKDARDLVTPLVQITHALQENLTKASGADPFEIRAKYPLNFGKITNPESLKELGIDPASLSCVKQIEPSAYEQISLDDLDGLEIIIDPEDAPNEQETLIGDFADFEKII